VALGGGQEMTEERTKTSFADRKKPTVFGGLKKAGLRRKREKKQPRFWPRKKKKRGYVEERTKRWREPPGQPEGRKKRAH